MLVAAHCTAGSQAKPGVRKEIFRKKEKLNLKIKFSCVFLWLHGNGYLGLECYSFCSCRLSNRLESYFMKQNADFQGGISQA